MEDGRTKFLAGCNGKNWLDGSYFGDVLHVRCLYLSIRVVIVVL